MQNKKNKSDCIITKFSNTNVEVPKSNVFYLQLRIPNFFFLYICFNFFWFVFHQGQVEDVKMPLPRDLESALSKLTPADEASVREKE